MAFVVIINAVVVLTVLFLVLKGVEHALPTAAFLLVIFPEESKLVLPGLFDLTTQRLIIAVLIIGCLLARKPADAARKTPLKAWVIALTIAWAVSAFNSVVITTSLKATASQVLDFFVVYFLFANYVTDTRTIRKILFGIVAGVALCSAFGLLEVYANWTIMSIFPRILHHDGDLSGALYLDAARGIRAQSTFGHPILLGAAIAMATPMALYLVSISRTAARKVFLWGALPVMFLCLYKTGSRGPWLATVLALGISAGLGPRKVKRYVVTIGLLVMLALVLRPGVWETIWNNYKSTLDPSSNEGMSYEYRYALYHIAFRELDRSIDRAVWGYGPESFFYLNLEGEFRGHTIAFRSCDNSIAALLVETGYLGTLIAAIVLLSGLLRAYQNCRRMRRPARDVCFVFLSGIAVFLFMMTNVAIFGWGQENFIFWIMMALAVSYRWICARAEDSDRVDQRTVGNYQQMEIPAGVY